MARLPRKPRQRRVRKIIEYNSSHIPYFLMDAFDEEKPYFRRLGHEKIRALKSIRDRHYKKDVRILHRGEEICSYELPMRSSPLSEATIGMVIDWMYKCRYDPPIPCAQTPELVPPDLWVGWK